MEFDKLTFDYIANNIGPEEYKRIKSDKDIQINIINDEGNQKVTLKDLERQAAFFGGKVKIIKKGKK